jgi:glycosyltransferase involved in cell wall biosynthesis
MRALRFLFIIDSLEIGGAEKMVLSLAGKLVELEHDVSLLVVKNSISLVVPPGVKLHVLNYRKLPLLPYNFIYAVKLRRLVSGLVRVGGTFDLKTSNLNLSNRLTHIARMPNVYYCMHEAVSVSSLRNRKGLKRFFRALRFKRILNGKDVITVSGGVEDDLVNCVGVRPRTIRTIYNSVDFSKVAGQAEAGENGIEGDYVVHVGRLSREKRHDILLKAYKASGIDARLVIVGDGPEKNAIESLISELELEDRVVLTGWLSNPYSVMKNAVLTLLSSDYEGLPTVLVESFVLSTPVVSVDCSYGPKEILGQKYRKYLARPGDIAELADRIRLAVHEIRSNRLTVGPGDVSQFDVNEVAMDYARLAEGRDSAVVEHA